MSKIETGGPAFPGLARIDMETQEWDAHPHLSGMTLRDYFAAKAMQGLIVGVEAPRTAYIAGASYAMADAMLAARKEKP